jgi:F-type H+-transporting ATPase subunit a
VGRRIVRQTDVLARTAPSAANFDEGTEAVMADPISQFRITNIHTFGTIGGHEIAITNSAMFMGIAVVGIAALMIGATASRSLVPGRAQSLAEMSYEFVANMMRSTAGPDGMRFFPLVFSLFMFILFLNLLGMFPLGGFTVTSHIIVTAGLALLVFFTVVIYGFWHTA